MTGDVRFVLNGNLVTLTDVDPTRTVLQYLREDVLLTGSKEGCAEGDCGACMVVVAELTDDDRALRYQAINACIQFLATLDGKELITVEALSAPGAALHPVQQAMVDCHGSQCGFCTPGFVMTLFAMYKSSPPGNRVDNDDALAGNLCRCTGYRPIVDAAVKMYDYGARAEDSRIAQGYSGTGVRAAQQEQAAIDQLRALRRDETLATGQGDRRYFAPETVEALVALLA
ncbi:MAG: 2Fe-2S iron-sulfur cluster-binding protein, partial [Pseudomonadota bacterium]